MQGQEEVWRQAVIKSVFSETHMCIQMHFAVSKDVREANPHGRIRCLYYLINSAADVLTRRPESAVTKPLSQA